MGFIYIMHFAHVAKGFLAGGFVIAGIINPFGLAIQAVLFALGIYLFVDGVVAFGEQPEPIYCSLSSVFGGAVSVAVFLTGFSVIYIVLMILSTILLYKNRISKHAFK